jgi:hypothetical protein
MMTAPILNNFKRIVSTCAVANAVPYKNSSVDLLFNALFYRALRHFTALSYAISRLAPDIKRAILDGTQPESMCMQAMKKSWPDSWHEQAKYFSCAG